MRRVAFDSGNSVSYTHRRRERFSSESFCSEWHLLFFWRKLADSNRMHVQNKHTRVAPVHCVNVRMVVSTSNICTGLELRLKANKTKTMSNPDRVKITYTEPNVEAPALNARSVPSAPQQFTIVHNINYVHRMNIRYFLRGKLCSALALLC